MTISEFCIRRPVATLLMSVSLVIAGLFAYISLPVAALPRADFPVINVSAQLPGRVGRDHGDIGRYAADQAVRHHCRHRQHFDHQFARLDLDRHPVRARPRYRRRRVRCAIGDRPHAARAAGRHAGAAQLSEGQSGRCADPAAGPEERHRSVDRSRCVRPAGDLAVAVDAERRGAGLDLRQPAIRRQDPARRGCARRARHIGRPDPGGRGGGQPEHAARHACRATSSN